MRNSTDRLQGLPGLFAMLVLLTACSSGSDPAAPPVVVPPPVTGPLPGDGSALAVSAIQTIDIGDTYSDTEVSVTTEGVSIVRTKLEIVFRSTATTAEVNALLLEINATITTSIAGIRGLVVRVPDPGTLAALDTLVANIEARSFVWMVRRSIMDQPTDIPANITTQNEALRISHHLAIGAHAAWNAKVAAVNEPRVVIEDWFGDGAPNANLDYLYEGNSGTAFATGKVNHHGYHVAGIIAGNFGGPSTERGWVTGMTPRTVRLSVVDHQLVDPLAAESRVLQQLQAVATGTVVLNTSLQQKCTAFVTCVDINELQNAAAWWVERVRTLDLESRVLHLTAAGNVKPPFFVDEAQYSSVYSAAALQSGLTDEIGDPLAPLTNTLSVENALAESDFPHKAARCLSSGSFHGGHISGIGTDVWSFGDASATAKYLSGTSMSTPQVAGLAAYLLSIRPELSPQDLITILRGTAKPLTVEVDPDCSDTPTPSPIIDAYAAVLALDRPAGLQTGSVADVPVRRAILDLDDNGAFTSEDLLLGTTELDIALGATYLDRLDFNGDTESGGVSTAAFDLDIDGSKSGSITASINGTPRVFDESALTDMEILCYYAYTNLYSGDAATRDQHLQPYQDTGQCGEASMLSASFPAVVTQGEANTLTVTLSTASGFPVAGGYLDLDVVGGTIAAASGTTDELGTFSTQATLTAPDTILTINVYFRAGPGGQILDTATVQATSVAVGQVVMLDRREGAGTFTDGNPPDDIYYFETGINFGPRNWTSQYSDENGTVIESATTDVVQGATTDSIASIDWLVQVESSAGANVSQGGNAFAWVRFRVNDKPVTYQLTIVAESGDGPRLIAANFSAMGTDQLPIYQVLTNYAPFYGYVVCDGDTVSWCRSGVITSLDEFGELPPGDYLLVTLVSGSAEGGSNISRLTASLVFNPPSP